MPETHVTWLRRDLRLHDQPALTAGAVGARNGGRLAVLFVLDDALLRGGAPNRTWFMFETLRQLAAELDRLGSALHVRAGDASEVVPAFAREVGAAAVHVSRDYAPFGRARDERVAGPLRAAGIGFRRHPGVIVHEPESILTSTGHGFTAFSPFHRAWAARDERGILPAPDRLPPPPAGVGRDDLPPSPAPTADPSLLPAPGEREARARLERWLAGPIERYDATRDRLDIEGSSRLSQDLRFGLLSAGEVLARSRGPGSGRRRFRTELAWRDFYAQLLWHDPGLRRRSYRAGMDDAFDRDLAAPESAELVDAWRAGRTGYPVVDAAMRQLAATGWMPNRARMIVASFLTKHLLVDWRVGDAHFWQHLVDGDVASNAGNWQWVASTGADAQPWFRIFNPVLQGRRFDPEASYVRRWVPELADLPTSHAHAPWTAPSPPSRYPAPIVDHEVARARALEALAAAARQPAGARRASHPDSPRRTS